jgi:soluble lytic murein transglycosylase-like protein
MDTLTATTLCVLCAMQPMAAPQTVAQWQPIIAEAATRFALPTSWIARVMEAESGGQTMHDGRPITSPAGAMGLMQVMPETYAAMRQTYHLGADPYDPHDNILAGTAFLRAMYDRYGYPALFAAYNAGPGRFEGYLSRHRSLPAETQAYVARVLGADSGSLAASNSAQNLPASDAQTVSPDALFFVREGQNVAAKSAVNPTMNNSALFVPLSSSAR